MIKVPTLAKCTVCGNPIWSKNGRRNRKYCSLECLSISKYERWKISQEDKSDQPAPTAQHIISAINDYEFKVYGQVYDGKEKVQLEEFIRKLTKEAK